MAEFEISEQDYVRASLLTVRRRLRITGPLLALAIAFLVISQALKGGSWVEALTKGVGAIAFLVVCLYFLIVRRLRKAYREHEALHQKFTLLVTDEEMKYSWPRGNMTVPWTAIRGYAESADFFILFESSVTGRILPKRALSEEEMALVRRKLDPLPRR